VRASVGDALSRLRFPSIFTKKILQIYENCCMKVTSFEKKFNMNPTIVITYNIKQDFVDQLFSVKLHLEMHVRFVHRNGCSVY
jgi:hypothetical protein